MPYADPAEQAEYNRNLFARRYQSDPEFREAEAFRKAQWYYRNQAAIVWAARQKRKKVKAARKGVRSGEIPNHPEFALLADWKQFPVLI